MPVAVALVLVLTSCRSRRIRDLDGAYAYNHAATTNANVRDGAMSAETAQELVSRENWVVLRGRWMARGADGALSGGAQEVRVESTNAPFYRLTVMWLDTEQVYTVEAVSDGLWFSKSNDPLRAKYTRLANAAAISAQANQLIRDAGLIGQIRRRFGIVKPYKVPKGTGTSVVPDEGDDASD